MRRESDSVDSVAEWGEAGSVKDWPEKLPIVAQVLNYIWEMLPIMCLSLGNAVNPTLNHQWAHLFHHEWTNGWNVPINVWALLVLSNY